jgi:plasmid stabilization system protein ParE
MATPSRTSAEWAEAAAAVRRAGEQLGIYRRRSGIGDASAFTLGILIGGTVGAVAALLSAPVDGISVRARLRTTLASIRRGSAIVPAPETAPATITLTTVRPTVRT